MPPNLSTPRFYAAQTTTVRVVKTGPTVLAGYYVWNPNSSAAYVQLFDTAGSVTLGTTTPTVSLGIPPTAAAHVVDGAGLNFSTGLQLACTTTATGNTAPSTGLDVNVFYQ